MRSYYGVGYAGPGESGYLLGPEDAFWKAQRPVRSVLFYLHGRGSANGKELGSVMEDEIRIELVRRLAMEDILVLASDWGGKTYANDPSNAKLEEARIAMYTKYNVEPNVPIGLLGISMGAAVGLAYARAFPSRVAFMAGMIPLLDIADFRNNNRGGFAAEVNEAYGGLYDDAVHGPLFSPVRFATTLPPQMPIKFWSGALDTAAVLPTSDQFLQLRPQTEREVFQTGHNSDTIREGFDSIIKFCLDNIPR